ncbi:sulfite reductase subunit alpha [Hyphomicrobium sp. D-2]|uniref:sulfite reductase subunit alpha n=1 Tax=Hyphomicrobium sp. D-2 TaxID=3041621 RepID=UPI00245557AE|nr:sulfite reductase subunit alpha [Hyphomicrobium sp. D-2]MDH4981680.1 sulfite reductase subunit alpha [Hyphomicrobium sp. D-2]
MTLHAAAPATPLIPESAPFTIEQRAWLNGFFAGLLSLDVSGMPAPASATPLLAAGGLQLVPGDDGAVPWHDPAMAIDERMQLAVGRPLRRRMMAAMAQQDCGQCGYNCEEYADAIAQQSEGRLNLCVPGGKATARMLKSLVEEMGGGVAEANPATAEPQATGDAAVSVRAGYARECPVEAQFIAKRRLNAVGSEKTTNHIEIDLSASGLTYQVGDSLGVYARNAPSLVDSILDLLAVPADFPIAGKPIRDALIDDTSLYPAPDSLFELISYITGGDRKAKARALSKGDDPDGDAATLDVLGALEKFRGIHPDPEAFMEALEPLQPRLYSISSSQKMEPGRVCLTVDAVRQEIAGRMREGLASTFLDDRIEPGQSLRVYVQKAHGFALPDDTSRPIIMVGPGTGIAPFRAFLQERKATAATGAAWLFFGHQRRSTDFLYEDELDNLCADGTLTRLSLAWSRDSDRKVYVQDKMRDEGAELFRWLEQGAHFYICGDAKRMARDVEAALVDIVVEHGKASREDAQAYVAALKQTARYQADVY